MRQLMDDQDLNAVISTFCKCAFLSHIKSITYTTPLEILDQVSGDVVLYAEELVYLPLQYP